MYAERMTPTPEQIKKRKGVDGMNLSSELLRQTECSLELEKQTGDDPTGTRRPTSRGARFIVELHYTALLSTERISESSHAATVVSPS